MKRWKEAGADRYLLRHETADACHYASLHPAEMSFEHRMQCLRDLKALGYQTGCGFMVEFAAPDGARCLARDMRFIEELDPEMVGIGPFIPQHDTPFGGGGGRNVGRDTVSFRAASPAEAESAASGDDSARNDSSNGTRTGDSWQAETS